MAQTIYHYEGGDFKPIVRVDVPDLGMMRLRTNAILELSTIDESKLTDAIKSGRPPSLDEFSAFIDRDSGVAPRTFVGSTVFLNESDWAVMVPTDELKRTNCGEEGCLARDESHGSLLVGETVKLRNAKFDQFIETMKRGRAAIEGQKIAEAKLSHAARLTNQDFIPLTNEDQRAFARDDAALATTNRLLPNDGAAKALIDKLNATVSLRRSGPFSAANLRELVDTAKTSPDFLTALCVWQTRETMRRAFGDRAVGSTLLAPTRCLKIAQEPDVRRYWNIERKLRVLDLDPTPDESQQMFLMNIDPGADISAGHSRSEDDSWGASVGVDSGLGKWLSKMPLAILGAIMGVDVGGKYSHGQSFSEFHGEKVGLGSKTWLGVDIHPVGLRLRRYQKCTSLRMRSSLVLDIWGSTMPFWHPSSLEDGPLRPEDRLALSVRDPATAGFLICDSREHDERITVPERYYFFSQQLNNGVMNDNLTKQGNPWLLELRGRADFLQFVGEVVKQSGCMGLATEGVSHGEGPIEQLARTYRYEARMPTVRGFYTEIDEGLPLGGVDESGAMTPQCSRRTRTWLQVFSDRARSTTVQ